VRLETERLLLREFEDADGDALYAIESRPEVARYQSFEPRTLKESRDYARFAREVADWGSRSWYELAIVRREDGRFIGRCGLEVRRREGRQAVLWYTIDPDCWGQGYATEAARALVDFGFAELRLHRVWADCDPRNTASWRLLERLGMRREAHHVEGTWLKGGWVDTFVYAVLARDWAASR
jgi:RimJ/RimL family protein N-acetyltransferase